MVQGDDDVSTVVPVHKKHTPTHTLTHMTT
jgi:hypothetical protein